MGSQSTAFIPVRPAPSARRACLPRVPNNSAFRLKSPSGKPSLRTRRAAMPAAEWWTPPKSHSSPHSWRPTRRGQSPVNLLRQPAGQVGRSTTDTPAHARRAVRPETRMPEQVNYKVAEGWEQLRKGFAHRDVAGVASAAALCWEPQNVPERVKGRPPLNGEA